MVGKIASCIIILLLLSQLGYAQQQSNDKQNDVASATPMVNAVRDSVFISDSTRRAKTRRATRHSAYVPGWGQFDNRQPWKAPIIYGALGFTTYLFVFNLNEYKQLRQAYIYRTDTIPGNDDDIPDKYKPLSNNSLRFYRDEYRKNVDYSALAFLVIWGLNVVDASVFANLRDFNVSDDLSIRLQTPNYNPVTGRTQVGLTFHLNSSEKAPKHLPAR